MAGANFFNFWFKTRWLRLFLSGKGRGRRLCLQKLKGLILAQNERWRRGLGMQVEREPRKGGQRRKGQ